MKFLLCQKHLLMISFLHFLLLILQLSDRASRVPVGRSRFDSYWEHSSMPVSFSQHNCWNYTGFYSCILEKTIPRKSEAARAKRRMEVDNFLFGSRNGVSFAEFSLSFVSKTEKLHFYSVGWKQFINFFYIDITIANKLKNRHVGSEKQTTLWIKGLVSKETVVLHQWRA